MGTRANERRHPLKRLGAASILLVVGANLTACSTQEPSESKLGSYAFAVSEYLYSPLREQNDDGETYEEIVARCMKAQGFEYRIPVTPSTMSENDEVQATSQFDLPGAATNGYDLVFPYSEFGEIEDAPIEVESDAPADPLASLSQSEADAYGVALYGTYAGDLAADPNTEWNWNRAGCLGSAEHELMVHPERATKSNPFEELMSKVIDTPLEVLEGPDWQTIVGGWSACMSAEGHTGFTYLDDARTSIEQEREALLDSVRPPTSSAETIEVTEDDDGIPDRTAWESLRRREIALATTDLRCRQDADLDGEYERLYAEVEQKFLEKHDLELEKMMVWISENSG